MVTSRVETPGGARIRSWEDLDDALRKLGEQDIRIGLREGKWKKAANELTERAVADITPLKEDRARLAKEIEEYCTKNRVQLVGKKKSRKFNYGRITWTKTRATVEIPDDDITVQLLEERGLDDCVNTTKKPDKTELKKLPPATLVDVGVTLSPAGEKFEAKPDRKKIEAAEG